ncbi:MAG: hypothetical protein AB7V42_00445 [Thermoleophilia bacterium]
MRSITSQGQLILFPSADRAERPTPPPVRRRRDDRSRSARMAARLDALARAAERDARECRLAGDVVGFRAARDRAVGARRAAQLLRAGPSGVAEVLGGHGEAA